MKKVHTVSKQILLKSLSVAIAAALGTSQALAQEAIPDISEALDQVLTVGATIEPGVCALNMSTTEVSFGSIIPKGTEMTRLTEELSFNVECQTKRRIAFQITDNNESVDVPVSGGPEAYRFGDVQNRDGSEVSVGHVEFSMADVRAFHHYNSDNLDEGVPLKFNPVAALDAAGSEFTGDGTSVFQKNEFLIPYETTTVSYDYNGSPVNAGSLNRLASGTDFGGKLNVGLVVRPNSELDISGDAVELSATYTFTFAYL